MVPHWPVTATACRSSPANDDAAIAVRAAATSAFHHSRGSCVAVPSRPISTDTGSKEVAAISPPRVTTPTLGPPLPRSIARIHRSAMARRPWGQAGRSGAGSYIMSSTPPMSDAIVSNPDGMLPIPYTAPEAAGWPAFSSA
ncbi:unannotated protein [freshwater metagenome]|uniref:Unannotated protein n=1 Tax=freshwater metagenome TaxID=449393 RepID=A0A6J7LBA6_9ZZZZ